MQKKEMNNNFRNSFSFKEAISVIHNINVDKTLKEQLTYNDDTFPLGIWTDIYDYFIDNTASCHWHHDFEYGILLDGEVDYYINNTHIKLKTGDAVFINSDILHMSKQAENSKGAVMYALTFPTSFLTANINSTVYGKYIQPLLNMKIEGFKIPEQSVVGLKMKALLMEIYETEPSDFGYEFKCAELVNRLWLLTFDFIQNNKGALIYRKADMRYSERIKEILSYIHQHYREKITATEIAEGINISRAECFRCFKRFMSKSLVEYINDYRLLQAAKLLRESDKNAVDISLVCGFENTSYFNKLFKEAYSMTPLQYRRARIWTDNTSCNINNYDYEYWKDNGNGAMIITANANNGSFSCDWYNINNISFRSGRKFKNHENKHKQLGDITLQYDAVLNSDGNYYLSVYGWTINPLVEFYIVESYGSYKPPGGVGLQGIIEADGASYEIYHIKKINKPSILGENTDFEQYWSVRTVSRFTGTVNVSTHLQAWENIGIELGNIAEIALSVEAVQSNGRAVVNTNIINLR